jgi:HSP20 family protein
MALLPIKRKDGSQGPLARFHNEMDDLFRSFFGDWDMPLLGSSRWPVIDIAENDDAFIVKAEVPGCKAEDINISVHDSRLIISGEKKQEQEEKGEKGYYHLERSYGAFRRELNLGSNVNPDKIDATYKDGVLNIKLPKSEKTKAVKVPIKTQ